MKFYDETQPLYLVPDASGVGLGAALLHTRNGTGFPGYKPPDISILRSTVFVAKSLSNRKNTVTLKERHHIFYMGLRSSIITVLPDR